MDGDTLTYTFALDALDESAAHYAGANGASVTIDRTAFIAQRRPLTIEVRIPTGDAPDFFSTTPATQGDTQP